MDMEIDTDVDLDIDVDKRYNFALDRSYGPSGVAFLQYFALRMY